MADNNGKKGARSTRRNVLQKLALTGSALSIGGVANVSAAKPGKVSLPTGATTDASNVIEVPKEGRGVKPSDVREVEPEKPTQAEVASATAQTTSIEVEDKYPSTNTFLGWGRNWDYFNPVGSAWADFTVPDKPNKWGSLIQPTMYYFPGLISEADDKIIQPVLGFNRYDGHEGEWAIASWWVKGNETGAHSTPIRVNPGDEIWGYMNQESDGDWYIQTYNTSTGESTDLTRSGWGSYQFTQTYMVLEDNNWSGDDCGYLPAGTTFYGIAIQDENGQKVTPDWEIRTIRDDATGKTSCEIAPQLVDGSILIHTPNGYAPVQ